MILEADSFLPEACVKWINGTLTVGECTEVITQFFVTKDGEQTNSSYCKTIASSSVTVGDDINATNDSYRASSGVLDRVRGVEEEEAVTKAYTLYNSASLYLNHNKDISIPSFGTIELEGKKMHLRWILPSIFSLILVYDGMMVIQCLLVENTHIF